MAVYAPASHRQTSRAFPDKARRPAVWIAVGACLAAGMILLGVVAYLLRPQPQHCGPPRCGTAPPPRTIGSPLQAPASYTSSAYGYTVDYPQDFAPDTTTDSTITWSDSTDGGPLEWTYQAESQNGRSADQVVHDLVRAKFGSARYVYTIPDANLGYQPGYGEVYDLWVTSAAGQSMHQRLVVMAAIKRGVAVVFFGTGPFVQTSVKADGHPNPAQTPLVHYDVFLQSTQSVTWQGDAPL